MTDRAHLRGAILVAGRQRRQGALRVGTMGLTASPHYVLPTLSALGMALRDLGYKADTGEALAAAQTIFDAEAP